MAEVSVGSCIISSLFPDEVVTVEAHLLDDPIGSVYPEEEAFICSAVAKRKQEFRTGRHCAHKALATLSIYNYPVLVGKDRAPVWPSGFVGSITHSGTYCGVALARNEQILSIGLDAELIKEMEASAWRLICTKRELTWSNSLSEDQRTSYLYLLFSAKECFYKCQYQLTGKLMGFHDVEIAINRDNGTFEVGISTDSNCTLEAEDQLIGHFLLHGGYVFTGMTLRRSQL